MHYYSHHVGDYNRDTAHLSIVEHGVYRLLMDSYYSTERRLPADHAMLCRIVRANSKAERDAVSSVARLFFKEQEGLLIHNRIERELESYQAQREQASKAGKASAAKRISVTNSQQAFNECSTVVELPLQQNVNGTSTNHKPITNNHKPITNNHKPLASKSSIDSKKKVKVEMSDEEWMASLKTDPNNQGINVDVEYSKACAWCIKNHKAPSRRFFLNWLGKAAADKPIAIVAKQPMPSVTGGIQLGPVNGRWVSVC